ncbi:hypothetical protein ACHQM5_008237 [Ranunculus cassubicifolius]
MGSFFSSFAPPIVDDSTESSKVVAFHNSEEWKTHFATIKDSSNLTVIDFTATWCGPCRIIAPVFAKFSNTFPHVSFVKIDVDELADVAKEFQVQAMPTFLLIKNGKPVDKVVGAKKDELQRKIEIHSK